MKSLFTVAAAFLLVIGVSVQARPIEITEIYTAPAKEIERRLPDSHPVTYLGYAARQWAEAKRDDAVFWFYVGQLRFRFHLAAHPDLDPSDDPALFGAMMDSVGEPINTYAGGDPVRMQQQIDRVLAWDAKKPNGFTSKTKFKTEWQQTRSGLQELQRYFATHVDEMRQAREQNGIGEIGMISPNGPYMEIRKAKMPADWPALLPRTTLADLLGRYESDSSGVIPGLFFSAPASLAGELELSSTQPNQLTVEAVRKGAKGKRLAIAVTETADAVVLTRTKRGESAGLSEGEKIERVSFRINDAHELVVQREIITDCLPLPPRERSLNGEDVAPVPTSKTVRHHSELTFWDRAKRLPDSAP